MLFFNEGAQKSIKITIFFMRKKIESHIFFQHTHTYTHIHTHTHKKNKQPNSTSNYNPQTTFTNQPLAITTEKQSKPRKKIRKKLNLGRYCFFGLFVFFFFCVRWVVCVEFFSFFFLFIFFFFVVGGGLLLVCNHLS